MGRWSLVVMVMVAVVVCSVCFVSGASAEDSEMRPSVARRLARHGGLLRNKIKPRDYILVAGVRVGKRLYDEVVKLAKARAETEYSEYERLFERSPYAPSWRVKLAVRKRTMVEARQLVENFFRTYRSILKPHKRELDYGRSQHIIRSSVEAVGNFEMKQFRRWFTRKFRAGIKLPGNPSQDKYNIEPGSGGNEPIAQKDYVYAGVSSFSNDPNALDLRTEKLTKKQLRKLRKHGAPLDWAGRLMDPTRGWKVGWKEGDPTGDANDAAVSGNPGRPLEYYQRAYNKDPSKLPQTNLMPTPTPAPAQTPPPTPIRLATTP